MNIRFKALTIIGGVVLALVVALTAATYFLVTGRFAQLEVKRTEIQVERIQNQFEALLSQLSATANDWGPWDETYRFVTDTNPEYVQDNLLDATFTNLRLNFMLFFGQDRHLVYSKFFALDPSQSAIAYEPLIAAIANHPERLSLESETSHWSGIVMTPGMPFMVAAHPIVPSDFKGPMRGTLVLGRALDGQAIETLSAQTKTRIELIHIDPGQPPAAFKAPSGQPPQTAVIYAAALDRDTIAGYARICDLFGAPAMLLKITQERDISRYGLATWRQNALILIGFGLVLSLLLIVLLDRFILNRVEELTLKVNSIAYSPDHYERIGIHAQDEIGQLSASIDTLLDARQAYHAEKEDHEKYLRQLLDSINCGVMVVDAANHHILDINAAGAALHKSTRDGIIGQLCHNLVCPNEIGNCPVTDHGATIDLSERRLLQTDGAIVPVIKSVVTVQRQGRTCLIESFIDISKLKKAEADLRHSEARYRQFFEDDLTGNFLFSIDGRLIDCNPAFARMFGYDDPDEIKSWVPKGDYLSIEDRRMLVHRLKAEGRLESIELSLRRRNGDPLYGIATLIGQFDGHGVLREVRGYLLDDTQRVLLEKDLRRAHKMEAIGTLAGGIAHDFNNILAAIVGYAEIALAELPEESAPGGRLKMVLKSANRAKELVQQILAFSRQSELENHPLQVTPVIKEAASLIRTSLPDTIGIIEQLESASKVMANPVQIHQVIMNLCTNAGHAMRTSGGRLTIRATDTYLGKTFTDRYPGVREGHFVCISIIDTGHGIAPQIMDRIFDPFFSTKEKNEGSGLGLSVVHGIVSKLKGAIVVASTPQGSQFDVYLPVAGEQRLSVPPKHSIPLPTGTESIVFIDDEELLVEIGTSMLKSLGYRVSSFANSQKAMQHILNHSSEVDLVIADSAMPGLSGMAIARQLRESLLDLPILLCAGYSEELCAETATALGIKGVVMKPMVIKELAAEIRKVLDQATPNQAPRQAV